VEVTTDRGRVSMKPKKVADDEVTVTVPERGKVRHALKQARSGKTRPWNKVKHDLEGT
jgi:hypothetical protein